MKLENLNLSRKGLLIIGVPLIFELSLAAALAGLTAQSAKDAAQAQWRQEQMIEGDIVFRHCFEALFLLVSYGMDRNEKTSRDFELSIAEIRRSEKTLQILCKGDKDSKARLKNAIAVIDSGVDMLRKVKSERERGEKNPLSFMNAFEKQAFLVKQIKSFKRLQHDLNNPHVEQEAIARKANQQDRALIMLVLGLGLFINIAVAIAVANFFSRSISSRLLLIADNSRLLAIKLPLNPKQEGSDEVALLDRTFHEMAAALAESAEKQAEIMKYSEDIICTIDNNSRILVISDSLERHLGYKPAELIGREVYDFMSEESAQRLQEHFASLKNSKVARPPVLSLKKAGGGNMESSWACHQADSEDCIFCVVHDVSDQQEQQRLKKRFVNIIGNQLRSRLLSIQTNLDEISKASSDRLNARGLKSMGNSLASSGRIVDLVDELLELERMEQGLLQLQFSSSDSLSVIREAVASVQSYAEQKKVQIESPEIAIPIEADSKRLVQILVNLLSNAIKYSPSESKVRILTEENEQQVVFSVCDEGPGLPPEAIAGLFARFKRLNREVDKSVTGTGLGLAICKLIAEQHDGSVGAENNADRGSRFWFSIKRSLPKEVFDRRN
ncbi:MAG: PAS domain S-box protein [Candidatus Obscuribacterales bacterium]|nr:PAS domain S-box protein [Candidatus Obscuribacterales bacterium]